MNETVSMEAFEAMKVEMLAIIADSDNRAERALENVTDLMLQMDNAGWRPLTGMTDGDCGPQLEHLKLASDRARTVVVGNPLAEHGIMIRRGYIWGTGIKLESGTGRTVGIPTVTDANQKTIFSQRARNELETAAATDGNLFMVLDKKTKKIIRIPLGQIGQYATDVDDNEVITHYKRIWHTQVRTEDGTVKSEEQKIWYPAWDLPPKDRKAPDKTAPMASSSQAMIHVSFNTHAHWHFGLPDLYNVLWWISSYKEYIEAGFSVTRALARFAVKATSKTAAGAARAAAKVATTAGDPNTIGSVKQYGQMANVSGGSDISAINKSGAEFDFESGKSLAALIAAGLHIDVDELLGSSKQTGDNQLSAANVKAMISRQGEWDDFLTNILTYFGIPKPNIIFPPIRSVAVHRAIQAAILAGATNTIWPQEMRDLLVQMLSEYGIEVDPKTGLPDPGQWVEFTTGLNPQAQADAAAALAQSALDAKSSDQPAKPDPNHPGTKPLATPKAAAGATTKGKKTPAGPLADGDHSQRGSAK